MFPLVIVTQKNMAHLSNHLREVQQMQMRFMEARNAGDRMESMLEKFALRKTAFAKLAIINKKYSNSFPFEQVHGLGQN